MTDEAKKKVREFNLDSDKVRVDKDGVHITDPELLKVVQEEGVTELNSGQSNVYVAVKW